MSIILALFLHVCSGSVVNRQASQSLHWQWVDEGKNGETVPCPRWDLAPLSHEGSSPVEQSLSLSTSCWPYDKSTFLQGVFRNCIIIALGGL